MTQTTHTPLPWAADEDDGRIYHADGDVNPTIAYVHRDNTSEWQWKADLWLLSAAADLLDALNYLLEQTIDQDLKHGIGLSEGEEDARKQALAAIAKATGNKVLPPDPEGKNGDRAKWAGSAIKAFQDETGADDEDALSDLLGDLMHWADRNDYDFNDALERGRWHYSAETSGENS